MAPSERPQLTPERQAAKDEYYAWKRVLKREPKANDLAIIKKLWRDALRILNHGDKEEKQWLPRDLDSDETNGRQHIRTLMEMKAHADGSSKFIELAKPFLEVITHPALLDCISVDTAVGGLFNFISGSNGKRAILFFNNLSHNLLSHHVESKGSASIADVEKIIVAALTTLRELLVRENRVASNDDLPDLIATLENIASITGITQQPVAAQITNNKIREIRRMIARAAGLLQREEDQGVMGISAPAVASTKVQREVVLPDGRHDNDKAEITDIRILPTEDEIRSDVKEFLPSTDLDQPHFLTDAAERHIDTFFRLLRHDIFGELKEGLGGLMHAIERNPALLHSSRLILGDHVRAYSYPGAFIKQISPDARGGLDIHISFKQPPWIGKATPQLRRKYWDEARRLDEGVLLCFVSLVGSRCSVLFFTASWKKTGLNQQNSLSKDSDYATVTTHLAARYEEDLKSLIRLSHTTSPLNPGVLIELPGVILGTFLPILETLQSMQKFSRLPFRQWILPEEASNLDIPPPLYARLPGFKFTLDSICKVNGTSLSLDVGASVDDLATINLIEEKTGLDKGQCKALLAALTREYALIQGPPGTGKSYLGVQLMRVLLDCKDIGPIVVVSYTNHALDQFLEHLIQIGVGHVIRVGGQSKSDALKSRNIRQVATAEAKTKSENLTLWRTKQALEDLVGPMKAHLAFLDEVKDLRPTWRAIKVHLSDRYESIYSQFSKVDEDGFSSVGDPFEMWIKGSAQSKTTAPPGLLSIDQLIDVANQNIHALKPWDRRRLFEHWKTEISEEITEKLFDTIEESERLRKERSKISDEINRRALEKAQVIGLTTTGLAGNINTLQHIGCKVVICEEAGEVMEPHMLSALLPSCEHFIQIGDHQQLRPRINNFKLSLESDIGKYFQLDRSQFERLSIPEQGRPAFPVAQLNVQRRMRPEVSNLIKQTIYPRLVDHHSTLVTPSVIGMRDDVFWLDHDNFEDGARGLRSSTDPDQHSFSNAWEVDMVHALVKHIVRQGVYSSSDIAVLTPYTGQLKELRSKMRSDFEIFLSDLDKEDLIKDGFEEDIKLEGEDAGENTRSLEKRSMINLLRLSTVDNFQGEESKIILVSLVRSNAEKKVGFLRTTNRINVLLSRAQQGMYLIGNARTYSNVPMWEQVLGLLSANDNISDALHLQCPRHPETEIKVSTVEDFAVFSPEGGCTLICGRKLSCGHKCVSQCHSENLHQVFACPLPCQRLHSPCRHPCQKEACGEPCGKCMFRVDNVQLPCGHSKDNVPCCLTQNRSEIECTALVQKAYPGCDHPVTVQCGQDVKSVFRTCPAVCNASLDCGHTCRGTCGKCNVKSDQGKIVSSHPTCRAECGRRFLTCNHHCTQPCHEGKDCGTCISACEIGCSHWQNDCTLQCSEPCLPCIDDCTWSCIHQGSCSMPCSAPCNRLPCDRRCSKKLACGHQCPGICGESCPYDYCQVCTQREDDFVDIIDMHSERRKFADIKPDEEPIIALTCGHFFTAKRLDTVVGLEEVYVREQGGFTLLKDSSDLSRTRPKCPECHVQIQQYTIQRYNRLINRAVVDDNLKRFQVSGQADILDLDLRIEELENELEISRDAIVQLVMRAKDSDGDINVATVSTITRRLRERDAQSFGLVGVHGALKRRMQEKIKPAKDLHAATVLSSRERSIDEQLSALSLTVMTNIGRDRPVSLGLEAVFFRLMSVILYDCFIIFQALKLVPSGASIRVTGGSPVVLARPFFDKCSSFIATCQDENLLKLGVEATLYYAKIARHYEMSHRVANPAPDHHSASSKYLEEAGKLLKNAKDMCAEPFQNSKNLAKAVTKFQELLGADLFCELEVGEVDPITELLMSGRRSTVKNFGDWHLCENGHPFAEEKRAKPMEIAHCPECGAIHGGVICSSAQGAGSEPEEGYVLEG